MLIHCFLNEVHSSRLINTQHRGRRALHIPKQQAPESLVTCKACSKVSTIMLSEFTSCPVLITKNLFHQLIYPFIHAMGSYPKSKRLNCFSNTEH
ncbi:hypothetical protein Hanom_Chr12g01123161 [Helianthus anomalus]